MCDGPETGVKRDLPLSVGGGAWFDSVQWTVDGRCLAAFRQDLHGHLPGPRDDALGCRRRLEIGSWNAVTSGTANGLEGRAQNGAGEADAGDRVAGEFEACRGIALSPGSPAWHASGGVIRPEIWELSGI